MSETVLKQVSALPKLEYEELREMWDSMFDKPPQSTNRTYMIRRMAYRIQELAFGGLSEEARKRMHELKRRSDTFAKKTRVLPPVGTQLVREYQGIEHRVMVLPQGFEYGNVTYNSLSEVARVITGTRWSGPKFFGLT